MLRVDRRQDMDELINFLARSGSVGHMQNFTLKKSHVHILAARR